MNNNGGVPDISQMLASVMSNPQFADMVRAIKEGSTGPDTTPSDEPHDNTNEKTLADESVTQEPEVVETPAPKSEASGLAMSPEMLAKLPQMISALSAVMPDSTHNGGSIGAIAKTSDEAGRRRQLFASLKPFLSSERRSTLDTIIKLTEMTGVIESFKGFGSGGSKV